MSPDHKTFLDSDSVQMLETQRTWLQNSCFHLERSNAELWAAIQETGPDLDFKQAIEVSFCASFAGTDNPNMHNMPCDVIRKTS